MNNKRLGIPIATSLNYKEHRSIFAELAVSANYKYDENFINLYEWYKERGIHVRDDGTDFSEEVNELRKNTWIFHLKTTSKDIWKKYVDYYTAKYEKQEAEKL